jgi:hypothetical protein
VRTTAEIEVYENPNKEAAETINKPSKLWYLLPILLGIIGGIVGYIAIKDKDRKMAKNLLIIGVAILIIQTILSGLAYTLMSSQFMNATAPSAANST